MMLTARQKEILQWVSRGKTNHEVGAILNLSPCTVKATLRAIYKKLNVHCRAAATRKMMIIEQAAA